MGSYINSNTDLLDRYVVMLRICVGSMLFDSAAEVTLGLCRIPYKPYIGFLASENIVLQVVNASMILLGLQGLKPWSLCKIGMGEVGKVDLEIFCKESHRANH